MKVLYVEDDQASRKLIQKGLGARGIEVVLAEDGTRAIEMLRKVRFDALILDIMMPGIDGLQVGRCARREGLDKEVPIVLLTAHPLALEEVVARRLDPVASLAKPVKLNELARVLEKACAGRKQR